MPLPSDFSGKPSNDESSFFGRQPERNRFLQLLGSPRGSLPRLPVIHFFGIAGIGKTWLLKHLQSLVSTTFGGTPTVRVDFTREGASSILRDDPTAVLSIIRTIASSDACPRFDLAYAYLRVRRGVAERSVLDHKGTNTAWGVIREILKAGLSTTAHGKVLGFTWTMAEKLYPLIPKNDYKRKLATLLQQNLGELETQGSEEIERSLVSRLASDLKEASSLFAHPFRAISGVVFLDTMEALDDPAASLPLIDSTTLYLRDLVCRLNGDLLFVLAGQNRMRWDELHPDWSDPSWLEEHPLSGLDESEARSYLGSQGIQDPELQTAMLDVCLHDHKRFHPLHLGLLADFAWVETKMQHRSLNARLFTELPPADWGALVRRFLRSIGTRAEYEWIWKLAITPEFDEEAARQAYSSNPGQQQDTAWSMLRAFSFLSIGSFAGEWYTIHAAMRQAIKGESSFKRQQVDSMHIWWNTYWSGRLNTRSEYQLAWFHLYMAAPQQALPIWAALANAALWGSPPNTIWHAELVSWWENVGLLHELDWSTSDVQAAFLNSAGLRRMTIGSREANLRRAMALNQKCFQMLTSDMGVGLLAENHIALAEALVLMPSGNAKLHVQEAIDHLKEALDITSLDTYPEAWAHAHLTFADAIGSLQTQTKDELQRGISYANQALAFHDREHKPFLWAQTQITLGNLYQRLAQRGDKEADNASVGHFHNALEVLTYETSPLLWATAHTGLCVSYQLKSVARRSPIQSERAYEHGVAALKVWGPNSFPEQFARTQNALGNIFAWMASVRSDLIESCFASYEAAANTCSREVYPSLWAEIQSNLGAECVRVQKNAEESHAERALGHLEAALEVLTPDGAPYEWALAQSRVGQALLIRRDLNPPQASTAVREAYSRALTVWSRDLFPEEWATVQKEVAESYWPSDPDASSDDLHRAIAHYEAALQVFNKSEYPMAHADLSILLTAPYLLRAMQEVDTPEVERFYMSRCLGHYRDGVAVISVHHWFGGVIRGANVIGRNFCQMFSKERLGEFDAAFHGLEPLFIKNVFTKEEEQGISQMIDTILHIADLWIERLHAEGPIADRTPE